MSNLFADASGNPNKKIQIEIAQSVDFFYLMELGSVAEQRLSLS
jgi:hypothetical protein